MYKNEYLTSICNLYFVCTSGTISSTPDKFPCKFSKHGQGSSVSMVHYSSRLQSWLPTSSYLGLCVISLTTFNPVLLLDSTTKSQKCTFKPHSLTHIYDLICLIKVFFSLRTPLRIYFPSFLWLFFLNLLRFCPPTVLVSIPSFYYFEPSVVVPPHPSVKFHCSPPSLVCLLKS